MLLDWLYIYFVFRQSEYSFFFVLVLFKRDRERKIEELNIYNAHWGKRKSLLLIKQTKNKREREFKAGTNCFFVFQHKFKLYVHFYNQIRLLPLPPHKIQNINVKKIIIKVV